MKEAPRERSSPLRKKRSLDNLLFPEKVPVETSLGTLYVRTAKGSDWKNFKTTDASELGTNAVQRLTNRTEDRKDDSPLLGEDLDSLEVQDFDALAHALAKRNGWGKVQDGPSLQALGDAMKATQEKEREQHKGMLDDVRRAISSSYGFLDDKTLAIFQDQAAGLADIRRSLIGSGTLQEAMRLASLSGDVLAGEPASTRTLKDEIYSADHTNSPWTHKKRTDELPHIYTPPRPEDTPVGRAAIESAEHSREAAKRMEALATVVGGLNETLVTNVLPSWFRHVERNQEHAKESLDQAANGLLWTKWAVIASVVVAILGIWVTVIATWAQVSITQELDHAASAQQKRTEALLREQIAVQKRLIEQQSLDAAQLRELLK